MARRLAGAMDGRAVVTQLSRGTRFALQDGGENLLPVFLLAGDGLSGIKALFQAEAGLGLAQAEDAGAVRQLKEKPFDVAFHRASLSSKAEFCQHLVERCRGGDSRSGMSGLCRPLEGTFVEFHHAQRRVLHCDGRRLQHFVCSSPAVRALREERPKGALWLVNG